MYIKYCKKEHNINNGCNNILIGTLESYVKEDENFSEELIYDNNEIQRKVYSDKNIEYSSEDLHKATGLKFDVKDGVGTLDISNSNGEISNLTLNYFSNKSGFTRTEGKIPNCFIYCLASTNEGKLDDGKKINQDYNSFFKIKNILDFCHTISNLLMKNVTLRDFDFDTSQDSINYIKNIQISVLCRDIRYKTSKSANITENNKDETLDEISKYDRWIFTKDERYKSVPEYRIAFVFIDQNGAILSVKKESKLLYLPEIFGISK